MKRFDWRSVFGKGGKITFGLFVPAHSRNGMLPPTLHVLQGTVVRVIASGDRLFHMLILRFYDLISGISMELQIAWSPQLPTRHCLHNSRFLS